MGPLALLLLAVAGGLDVAVGSSGAQANRLPEERRKGRDGWGPATWETRNGVSSFGWDAQPGGRRPARCPRCPQPDEYRGNGYDNLSPEWQRRQEQQGKDWQRGSGGYSGEKRVWAGTIRPIEEQPGGVVTNWMGGPQRWRSETWEGGAPGSTSAHHYHSTGGYAGSYGYSQGGSSYAYAENSDGYKPSYYDRSRGESGYINRYNQEGQPYDNWATKNYAIGWDYYEQRPGTTHAGGFTYSSQYPPQTYGGPTDPGQGGAPYGPSSGGSFRPTGYDDYDRRPPAGGGYGRPGGDAWAPAPGWETYGRSPADYGDGYNRPTTGVTRPSVAGYGSSGGQNQQPWYEFGRPGPDYDRPIGPSRPPTDYGRPTPPSRPPVDYGRPSTDYGRPTPEYERPKPDYNRPAPPVNRPGIDYGRPTTDYNRPSTDYGRPAPEYGRPAPDYGRPSAPDYSRPHIPGYGGPSTDYGRPAPDYGRPSPDYGRPAPDYGRPSPDYGRPSPDYGRPSTGYGRPSPDYGRPSPDYGRPAPIPPYPDYGRPSPPGYGGPTQDSGISGGYGRPSPDYGRPGPGYGPDRSPDYGRPSHPDYVPQSGCSTCRPDPEHPGSGGGGGGGGSSVSRPGVGSYGSSGGNSDGGSTDRYGTTQGDDSRRDEQTKPLDRYPGHTGVGAPFEFDSDRKQGSYFYDRPTTSRPTTTTTTHSSTSSSPSS